MRNENLRTAVWLVALVVLGTWMALGWLRYHPGERLHLFETPFDKTPGLDEARWRFLQQVDAVLPEGAAYTIRAETSDEEMQLFMLAASVVERHSAVPHSYYGALNPGAESVQWIASYRCAIIPPGTTVVARMRDGCVCERAE